MGAEGIMCIASVVGGVVSLIFNIYLFDLDGLTKNKNDKPSRYKKNSTNCNTTRNVGKLWINGKVEILT